MLNHRQAHQARSLYVVIVCLLMGFKTVAQNATTLENASLGDCIHYALDNQPIVKQALLDEEINKREIKASLSYWWPQLAVDANFQHNLKLPTSVFPNFTDPTGPKTEVTTGVKNNSSVQLVANQALINSNLILAGSSAKYLKREASQSTISTKTDVVMAVSKAYYDVLLTQQQMKILSDQLQRLQRNEKDAYSNYQSGVTDKIDYKRATISVNNTLAEQKAAEESLKGKYAYLKQLLGYPTDQTLTVQYDSVSMTNDLLLDTTTLPNYEQRIEYQLLSTQMALQKVNIKYNKLAFLPSLSAFADYNLVYQNDEFAQLYNKMFPNSAVGLTLSFPIFQGTLRYQNIKKANLQMSRLQLSQDNLKSQISTEYEQSLASYKSSLAEYNATLENKQIAQEVNDVVRLQYTQGIKAYLEVITSETDLSTAQINHLNATLKLLSAKLDVQKALGKIPVN